MLRTIVEENSANIAVLDVFSKLIQNRIIFIDGPIDDEISNAVIAQLLYLDSINNSEISIYINSPGGIVLQGLAIYDVSKLLKSPIRTVGIGEVASMGAVLMLMGSKRCGLPHTRFMLHQVSGGAYGTLDSMQISIKEAELIQQQVYKIIKDNTTLKDVEEILRKDTWMGSKEALECGLINSIL